MPAGLRLAARVILRHQRRVEDVTPDGKAHVGESSWWLIGAIAVVALRFVDLRGHDNNFDLRSAHYFQGYWFLHGRFALDIAAAGPGSTAHPLPNALAYAALAWLPFPASSWLLAVVQLLALPVLAIMCREIGRDLGYNKSSIAELSALSLCVLAPLWWSELGTTFTESVITPVVLVGLLLGLRGAQRVATSQPADIPLVVSGLAFGLAAGLKLTNVVFAVAFLVALISMRFAGGGRLRAATTFGVGLVLGFATTAWWNVYLVYQWGSPLFPFYNALFKSPYYPPVNFHDPRWKFDSLYEFLAFLPAAVVGTRKTGEIRFADARLLLFVEAFVVACVVCLASAEKRRSVRTSAPMAKAFLIFFSTSLALWAFMFAYQRYLLPIELLFGVGLWILFTWTFGERKSVAALLLICTLGSFTFLSIPDWAHRPRTGSPRDVFGLKLPGDLTRSPADYLILGAHTPISYILPFLHPQSRFFSMDFPRPQVDAMATLVRSALQKDRSRPVRVLAPEKSEQAARAETSRFGYVPSQWSCRPFVSDTDRYVVCQISADAGPNRGQSP